MPEQIHLIIPQAIERAIKKAGESRFCTFLSEAKKSGSGNFIIQAKIGPAISAIGKSQRHYAIELIIPPDFPYTNVDIRPINPELKWHPHQNGDWANLGDKANIICPPNINSIYLEQGLLPYIKHAYNWITDALSNTLVRSGHHYEFPHLSDINNKGEKYYTEGNTRPFLWLRKHQWGTTRIAFFADRNLFLMRKLFSHRKKKKKSFPCSLNPKLIGADFQDKWMPWLYADSPVKSLPHRPFISANEFSAEIKLRLLKAIRYMQLSGKEFSGIFICFGIPETWAGEICRAFWVYCRAPNDLPSLQCIPTGFTDKMLLNWPTSKTVISKLSPLDYSHCIDCSDYAMNVRSRISFQIDIAFIGYGSLGSIIFQSLRKIGFKKASIFDPESLEPGNIIRHIGSFSDLGKEKVKILTSNFHHGNELLSINPVNEPIRINHTFDKYDLILDFSGRSDIHEMIQFFSSTHLCWGFVTGAAEYCLLFCLKRGERIDQEKFYNNFLPNHLIGGKTHEIFKSLQKEPDIWPEPGCYHPTFSASFTDMAYIAEAFSTIITEWIENKFNKSFVTILKRTKNPIAGMKIEVLLQEGLFN